VICDPCKRGGNINKEVREALKEDNQVLVDRLSSEAIDSHQGCWDPDGCPCAHKVGDHPIGEKKK
jgi:hypothetical protein